jgi:Gamma-glutamyl cyclotransferase, AIG2-like
MDRNMSNHHLFSYGTLQLPHVQLANFGRLLDGVHDTLVGYFVEQLEIKDPDVLSRSGQKFHPILRYSGHMLDQVTGTAFAVTDFDLDRADRYEVDDYERVQVTLLSGRLAWVYVERAQEITHQD